MATLGRFDIYYPDGTADRTHLTGDRVSVGRAADNSIVVQGDLIADFHFELRVESGVIFLINLDSFHGTRIGGQTLLDSQPHPLDAVAEINIGSLRIVFHAGSDQPTKPVTSVSESTQIIKSTFDVKLDHLLTEVFPASSASVEILISNRLAREEQFTITVDGLPEGWAKLSQTTALLDGGERQTVHLNITPPRRADIPPADFPVTIAVKAQSGSGRELLQSLSVKLREFAGLSVAADPSVVDGDETFRLYLLNQGNAALRLSLGAQVKNAELKIELSQSDIVLNAGQRAHITGIARGRRPLSGNARTIPFALLARAENASRFLVAIPATVVLRPRISKRVLATFALLIGIVIAYLLATLTQGPPPAISNFELSAAQVARGTPVALRWQADAADRFVIEVDRIAIAELPADVSEFVFRTDQHIDPVEIALIAIQGEEKAIESRDLIVYQPVTNLSFFTNRSEMWRNVGERLVIEWQAEGAIRLDVKVPDEFEVIYDERGDDGKGRIVLYGAPTMDFNLILNAEDELGYTVERRIDIRVLDPECTPVRDTPVFAGPDARFPQTQVAIENVPVLVKGINEGKDWLQVELANGESGWGFRGGFFCESFDPDALRVITDVPHLPTESATPTLTATATSPAPTSTPSATATLTPTSSPAADA